MHGKRKAPLVKRAQDYTGNDGLCSNVVHDLALLSIVLRIAGIIAVILLALAYARWN